MIDYACPVCNAALQAAEGLAGLKVNCPKCGQRLQVPAPARNKIILGNLRPQAGVPPAGPAVLAASPPPAVPKTRPGRAAPPPNRTRVAWHYQRGERCVGPVLFAQLQELAGTGQLDPGDLVRAEGMGLWLEARKVKGLFPDAGAPGRVARAKAAVASRARRSWQRFRSAGRRTQVLVAASACLGVAAVAVLVAVLAFPGNARDGDAQASSRPEDAEFARLDRQSKAAEERATQERAIAAKLRQEIKTAEDRAAAEAEKLKGQAQATEEKAAQERAIAEKLKQGVKAAQDRAAQEQAPAEKAKEETKNGPGSAEPHARVVDMREAMRKFGFSDFDPDCLAGLALMRFVRFRSYEKAPAVERDVQEQEDIAKRLYAIRRCAVHRDGSYLFRSPGVFVQAPEGFHLLVGDKSKAVLSKSLRDIYSNWTTRHLVWFLTKEGTLRKCLDGLEAEQIERAGGFIYYQESLGHSELILKLDVGQDVAEDLGGPRYVDYQLDVVVTGLRWEQALEYGFFRKTALVERDWNCEALAITSARNLLTKP